jgi:hypothetical protein
MIAADSARIAVLKILLEHGADQSAVDRVRTVHHSLTHHCCSSSPLSLSPDSSKTLLMTEL